MFYSVRLFGQYTICMGFVGHVDFVLYCTTEREFLCFVYCVVVVVVVIVLGLFSFRVFLWPAGAPASASPLSPQPPTPTPPCFCMATTDFLMVSLPPPSNRARPLFHPSRRRRRRAREGKVEGIVLSGRTAWTRRPSTTTCER